MINVTAILSAGLDAFVWHAAVCHWVNFYSGGGLFADLPRWQKPADGPGLELRGVYVKGLDGSQPQELADWLARKEAALAPLLDGSADGRRTGFEQTFGQFTSRLEALGAGPDGKSIDEVRQDQQLGMIFMTFVLELPTIVDSLLGGPPDPPAGESRGDGFPPDWSPLNN